MPSAIDVAKYILERRGEMTAMKLQKLVYYAQAWSLVWEERPIFDEPVEAWANGPVVRSLFERHRGQFKVDKDSLPSGDARRLSEADRETIDAVLQTYGSKSSQWLSDLTHRERPWRRARKGLRTGQRGSEIISHRSMSEYYESLYEPEESE